MENTLQALNELTEQHPSKNVRRQTRTDTVSWSLRPDYKQLVQILAKAERLSVSDLIAHMFTIGLRELIEGKSIYDPKQTPEDILGQFAELVRTDPRFERARQLVIEEQITRTGKGFQKGDEVRPEEIEEID